ncbi:MAG: S46 family peptidase [Bacteroidales bacterium]|nr:S46 family peptidase [Bacteroidales bacterium]
MKRILATIAALTLAVSAFADEGMWLLPLLQKMNGKAMKDAGLKLSPKDIYNINGSSLKDAIVQFGGGCTGEVISGQGLVVTNHHCGYSAIQRLSTDEHNYLMDGFWARSIKEEIPAPGLTVTFLVSMKDVTADLAKIEKKLSKKNFGQQLQDLMDKEKENMVNAAKNENPGCDVVLQDFYSGNVLYIMVYKTYKDVRFVGAPPASMGKFGGETDNWVWPRHTCDFSMFRIYADTEGNPADYSEDNIPLRSPGFLKISLAGVKENDYAMVMGYPGRTQRYQTAAQLEQMIRTNRIRIDARTIRQDIMWEAMCADPSVNLKYANKYASSANGWKKWQGEELAFENLGIIAREKQKEAGLTNWIRSQKPEKIAEYGRAIQDIEASVEKREESVRALTLITEAPMIIELLSICGTVTQNYGRSIKAPGADTAKALADAKKATERLYKDYVPEIDRKEAVALLSFYRDNARKEDYLTIPGCDFATMDFEAYVNDLFAKSVFTSPQKLAGADAPTILKDPAYDLFVSVMTPLMKYYGEARAKDETYTRASKAFTKALMEWKADEPMYPDANFTMRLTYGNVLPYSPKDAVLYKYYSTDRGILEKAKQYEGNPEFIVPEKLRSTLLKKDYGQWADADGSLHTCFLTNNDITGGNSGSPVLNAKGELIGLAFDGNWESMSSDVMFEPDLQRCICVDIRYVLFTVEKIGGAANIINELTFAGNDKKK